MHSGAELDLFFVHDGKRVGVELKREDAPRVTRSMRVALEDLRLNRLLVVYPGERRYEPGERIECMPLSQVAAAA